MGTPFSSKIKKRMQSENQENDAFPFPLMPSLKHDG